MTKATEKDADREKLRRDGHLEGSVMSQMILAMNLIVRPFIETHAKTHDLPLPEWRVMMALANEPERSGEDIARTLAVDRMGVSRALRRLEAKGRAQRRVSPQDRKRNLWTLTEEGWHLFDAIAVSAEARQDEVLRGLTATERRTFLSVLEKVIEQAR
jgi:DNA-binding MarR family transcriptional regulator